MFHKYVKLLEGNSQNACWISHSGSGRGAPFLVGPENLENGNLETRKCCLIARFSPDGDTSQTVKLPEGISDTYHPEIWE